MIGTRMEAKADAGDAVVDGWWWVGRCTSFCSGRNEKCDERERKKLT